MKGSSSPPSQSDPSSMASTLAGMGLFLATVAVSQWIQIHHKSRMEQQEQQQHQQQHPSYPNNRRRRHRRRRRDTSRSTDEDWYSCCNTSAEDEEPNTSIVVSKEAFQRRRLQRRMSFEFTTQQQRQQYQSRHNISNISTEGLPGESQSSRDHRSQPQSSAAATNTVAGPMTEWSIHQSMEDHDTPVKERLPQEAAQHPYSGEASAQTKRGREAARRQDREGGLLAATATTPHATNHGTTSASSVILNDRYHDFHPKYQNWRHFEHCNEHDRARAKQKRKSQLLRQHNRSLQQQQQDPGEGASQDEDKESRRQQNPPPQQFGRRNIFPEHQRQNKPKHSRIDNGSDEESYLSFDDDNDDNDDKNVNGINNNNNSNNNSDDNIGGSLFSSEISYGCGNEFIWTGGPSSKHDCDESSKSDLEINVKTNEGSRNRTFEQRMPTKIITKAVLNSFGPQPLDSSLNNVNQPAIRSGTTGFIDNIDENEASRSITNNKNKRYHANNNDSIADNRMGKFQRFYRMLTSSIIDDESSHIRSNSEDVNRISISSNSTDFAGGNSSNSSSNNSSLNYDGDVEDRHRALRTEYNAQIMPEKLVLIRHGQSMGNVDETHYATTPDNGIALTDLGWEQARKAGTILKDKIITPGESVHFIVSPYVRTVETFHGIVSAWCNPDSEEFSSILDHNRKVNAWYEKLTELGLTWNEDSRIREQDFGNYQNPEVTKYAKEERFRFGAFYYRFHNGESGSDVFDRVSTFLDSLWRSFETNKSQNYVLVTHGIVLRVLMARYFRYTISQLNTLANPRNCEMVVLGHEGNGRLDLEGRCSLELEEDAETKVTVVKGYKFHKRLRILPKSHIRTVRFRISPLDHKNKV